MTWMQLMAASASAKTVGLVTIAKFLHLAQAAVIATDMEQRVIPTAWTAVPAVAMQDGLAATVSKRPLAAPENTAVAMASPLATNSQMVAVAHAIPVILGCTATLLHLALLQWTAVVMGLPTTWTRQTVVRANVKVDILGKIALFHHLALMMMTAMGTGRQPTATRRMDVIARAAMAGQVMIVTHLQRARQVSTAQVMAAARTWTAQTAASASARLAGVEPPARFLHLAGKLLNAMGTARPRMQTD
jgi:hypothetical protein